MKDLQDQTQNKTANKYHFPNRTGNEGTTKIKQKKTANQYHVPDKQEMKDLQRSNRR